MSYTVDITTSDLPESHTEAYAEIERRRAQLYAEIDPDRSVFLPLYETLVSRYPCICDEPDGEQSPWCDGPLIDDFGSRHAIIGSSFPRVADTLPYVLEQCARFGFVVYDGQDDRFHPDKKRLENVPTQRKSFWKFWK